MGFFDLAVAAPSMKAELEAWGSKNNLFHQGFAQEVDDIDVVAATMKRPGVVLKRPVGSDGPFLEQANLPASLPNHKRGARKPPSTPIKRRRALDDKSTRRPQRNANGRNGSAIGNGRNWKLNARAGTTPLPKSRPDKKKQNLNTTGACVNWRRNELRPRSVWTLRKRAGKLKWINFGMNFDARANERD